MIESRSDSTITRTNRTTTAHRVMEMEILVSPFQLLQWKHAISLEAKGIKIASRSVKAHAARHFGLSPRAPYDVVAEYIDAAIDACKAHGAGALDVVAISPE